MFYCIGPCVPLTQTFDRQFREKNNFNATMEPPRRGRSGPALPPGGQVTAPVEALGPAATPDGARRRRSREMGNIARGGYGGRTAVDPGVAWKSLEPAEGPNKAKAGHDRTGDDAGDGPGKFKHPKTRSGRVSLPPRSPTPSPPPTPFPPSTPPPTPPPSVAGASLCCGSRIVDVRLLQDFISTRTCCRKCAEWHLAHQLTEFVNLNSNSN